MEHNKILSIALILLFNCSCGSNNKVVIVRNILSIKIPERFTFLETKGIDTYTFELRDKNGVTFRGELGEGVNDLYEPVYPVFDISLRDSIFARSKYKLDSNTVHFSDNPSYDADQRIFAKQYYLYDTINGIVSKVVLPKRANNGITGVFIPKLKSGDSFCLFAENVDDKSQQALLNVINSIQYVKTGLK